MKDTLRLELTQCWSLCFGKFILIVWHWIIIWICYFPLYLLWSSSPHLWKSLTIFFLENLVFFFKKIKLQLHGKLSFQSFHITSYEFKIFSISPPFFGLKKHFLKDLNRISSYKCNTICLYIHFFWRTSCLLTHFNNFEKSCSKHLYSCFLGKILLFWVHLSAFNFLPDIQ